MKKIYKTPAVKMIDYRYNEQVNATSPGEVEYCFVTIWKNNIPGAGCKNPQDWVGEQVYLTQELNVLGLW